jgi:hypothetical protein
MTRTLQSIQTFFLDLSRPLAAHWQRLPHRLRLLLMYQDNPIPASVGKNFFWRNRTCPADTAFLADFRFFFAKG